MVTQTFLGALAGLLAGFLLALLIRGLLSLTVTDEIPPDGVITFMGMAVGTVLGGVFGGITSLRK